MSGFYIGIDGKARKVKGAYIGVDGKARKIKKGYIGVDGVARLCYSDGFDPLFANNTWEDVITACQNNTVPDTWSVGDQMTMTIGGTDYAIDIIGKNHDDYSDGSGKAPLTFQLHGLFNDSKTMNNDQTNSTGWMYSDMRQSHLPSIYQGMPVVVRDAIRLVNKKTSSGNQNSTIVTTSDKLFLLSEFEIVGMVIDSFSGEGSRYAYYDTNNKRMKGFYAKGESDSEYWWTRSPKKNNTIGFCCVNRNGQPSYTNADYSYGVSPAFCF